MEAINLNNKSNINYSSNTLFKCYDHVAKPFAVEKSTNPNQKHIKKRYENSNLKGRK